MLQYKEKTEELRELRLSQLADESIVYITNVIQLSNLMKQPY